MNEDFVREFIDGAVVAHYIFCRLFGQIQAIELVVDGAKLRNVIHSVEKETQVVGVGVA